MLEWAVFANQYHLERLQEEAVKAIVPRYSLMVNLPEYEELSQDLLRQLIRASV